MGQVYVVTNWQSEHVVAEGVRGLNPRVGFRRVDIPQIFEYRCKRILQTTEGEEEC